MKRDLIELYSYFTRKLYGYEFFYLKLTDNHRRTLINFLVESFRLVDSYQLDRDYFFDYCSFQFEYLPSKLPRYKEKRIPVNQIFNKVALNRWLEKNDNYMYYVHENLRNKGIFKEEIVYKVNSKVSAISTIPTEEREKQRFHNTVNGLSHCILATSLYNHNSSWCMSCKFADSCKKLLRVNLLPIYVDRGYHGI